MIIPSQPSEHPRAGHPTLRAICEAARDGREVWTVKELEAVFPGMQRTFLLGLARTKLETTAHCLGRNGKASHRITTRSLVAYFLQTTRGLSHDDLAAAVAVAVQCGMTKRALLWLRGIIDRQLAKIGTLPEMKLPGDDERRASAAAARAMSSAASNREPSLFDTAEEAAPTTPQPQPATSTPSTP